MKDIVATTKRLQNIRLPEPECTQGYSSNNCTFNNKSRRIANYPQLVKLILLQFAHLQDLEPMKQSNVF
jgi:hypothetical protein